MKVHVNLRDNLDHNPSTMSPQGEIIRKRMESWSDSGMNMICTDGDLVRSKIFLKWYNSRIHGSLDYRDGENPGMALIRKMPPVAILGLFLSRNK
jgi:hypothetical protein